MLPTVLWVLAFIQRLVVQTGGCRLSVFFYKWGSSYFSWLQTEILTQVLYYAWKGILCFHRESKLWPSLLSWLGDQEAHVFNLVYYCVFLFYGNINMTFQCGIVFNMYQNVSYMYSVLGTELRVGTWVHFLQMNLCIPSLADLLSLRYSPTRNRGLIVSTAKSPQSLRKLCIQDPFSGYKAYPRWPCFLAKYEGIKVSLLLVRELVLI